jgi:hypothetical protein
MNTRPLPDAAQVYPTPRTGRLEMSNKQKFHHGGHGFSQSINMFFTVFSVLLHGKYCKFNFIAEVFFI